MNSGYAWLKAVLSLYFLWRSVVLNVNVQLLELLIPRRGISPFRSLFLECCIKLRYFGFRLMDVTEIVQSSPVSLPVLLSLPLGSAYLENACHFALKLTARFLFVYLTV